MSRIGGIHSSATKRRKSPKMEYYDLLFGTATNLPLTFSNEAEKLIQSVEAEKLADDLFAGACQIPLSSNKMVHHHQRVNNTRPNRKDLNDFDISTLNLDEPAPEVVSELPNGHGVTIVGTRLPNGEVITRIKYDRNLILALSHSPFSLAQPENYPQIVHDMDEIIPVFPKRYIPREFCHNDSTLDADDDKQSSP